VYKPANSYPGRKSTVLDYSKKGDTMTGVGPEGENVRKAVQWISDKRQYEEGGPLATLIEEASGRFNLSPKDEEFLFRFFKGKK